MMLQPDPDEKTPAHSTTLLGLCEDFRTRLANESIGTITNSEAVHPFDRYEFICNLALRFYHEQRTEDFQQARTLLENGDRKFATSHLLTLLYRTGETEAADKLLSELMEIYSSSNPESENVPLPSAIGQSITRLGRASAAIQLRNLISQDDELSIRQLHLLSESIYQTFLPPLSDKEVGAELTHFITKHQNSTARRVEQDALGFFSRLYRGNNTPAGTIRAHLLSASLELGLFSDELEFTESVARWTRLRTVAEHFSEDFIATTAEVHAQDLLKSRFTENEQIEISEFYALCSIPGIGRYSTDLKDKQSLPSLVLLAYLCESNDKPAALLLAYKTLGETVSAAECAQIIKDADAIEFLDHDWNNLASTQIALGLCENNTATSKEKHNALEESLRTLDELQSVFDFAHSLKFSCYEAQLTLHLEDYNLDDAYSTYRLLKNHSSDEDAPADLADDDGENFITQLVELAMGSPLENDRTSGIINELVIDIIRSADTDEDVFYYCVTETVELLCNAQTPECTQEAYRLCTFNGLSPFIAFSAITTFYAYQTDGYLTPYQNEVLAAELSSLTTKFQKSGFENQSPLQVAENFQRLIQCGAVQLALDLLPAAQNDHVSAITYREVLSYFIEQPYNSEIEEMLREKVFPTMKNLLTSQDRDAIAECLDWLCEFREP